MSEMHEYKLTTETIGLDQLVMWAIKQGFSTGHADTIESLLSEIELDIAEMRAKVGNE